MSKKPSNRSYPHTSFYLNPSDKDILMQLSQYYGMNASQVIRRLITIDYALIKNKENKND